MRNLLSGCLLLCFLLPGQRANAEMVCMPGPTVACVDVQTFSWLKVGEGNTFGHDYWRFQLSMSGWAALGSPYIALNVRLGQLVTGVGGNPVHCITVANPAVPTDDPGPLECAISGVIQQGAIAPDGSWGLSRDFWFYRTSFPFPNQTVGEPVEIDGTRVVGLAGLVEGPEGPMPADLCGEGFFGPWLDVHRGECLTSTVPEPSTVFLLATGLFGIGFVAWRRKEED